MIKAHSLLYAIYICLIISLLCGALLYMSNLYNNLNLYYTTHEELYISNQSVVNYALGHLDNPQDTVPDNGGIKSAYSIRPYGFLKVLKAESYIYNDTVISAHFVGQYQEDKTCLYYPSFNFPLTYSGKVILNGKKYLPSTFIEPVFLSSEPNSINSSGEIVASEKTLPQINEFNMWQNDLKTVALSSLQKVNDSVYFNSFLNETINISITSTTLSNVIIKGNFMLKSADSLYIKNNTVLNDVIVVAPKIAFEDNFNGSVQAFATKSIYVGKEVTLNYPSVLSLKNNTQQKSKITVGENTRIEGGVILYGNTFPDIENNIIETGKNCLIIGDVYCTGVLVFKGKVNGSVYTNRLMHATPTANYQNCLADGAIDAFGRPDYFLSLSLFNQSGKYGLLKKLL